MVNGEAVVEGDEVERADGLICNPIFDQDVEVEEVACLVAPPGWVSRVVCSFFLTCCGTQVGVGLLRE